MGGGTSTGGEAAHTLAGLLVGLLVRLLVGLLVRLLVGPKRIRRA